MPAWPNDGMGKAWDMEGKEALKRLLEVARGEAPADLVLTGGQVTNVFTGEVAGATLALAGGRVAGLGDYQGREEVDVSGLTVCPGFIDGHLHVESTLLAPAELARVVSPHGSTALVCDPHEIANVMGLAGVEAMLNASEGLWVDFFFNAPSCVPATPLETSGAVLGAEDLVRLAGHARVPGLAEMMNFPGTVSGQDEVLDKILAFAGRPLDGHSPLLGGKALNAYLAAGPDSDHECTNLAEAREKLAKGMWVMIRQGTSAKNLADLLPLVNERTERRCMLVSDDRHPDDLARNGHLDATLRQAVALGLEPMIALRLVTLNPARRFGLGRRGAVAPGYAADLTLVKDLESFEPVMVFKEGRLVAKNGRCLMEAETDFPDAARRTMNPAPLGREAFTLPVRGSRVRVIELAEEQILTGQTLEEPPAANGFLAGDPGRDLALLAVVERHHSSGRVGHGLLRGLKLKAGALASSVAHDSHNLVAAGSDIDSMFTAARRVVEMGGGLAVARGKELLGELPLPLAGLMSDQGIGQVLAGLEGLNRAAARVCGHPSPFMPLSFTALAVIPELRLTDLGLVDVNSFRLVDLFAD